MRRCGRASCVVLIGVLAATTVASSAFAARGGRQGIEHGKAKGHIKHAAQTPLLSPQPVKSVVQIRTAKPTVAHAEKHVASSPGVQVRHNHLTICHRTGSGRYIVISPNVNGATNGHLRHHDDFVYADGCGRAAPAPRPAPAPEPSPKPLPEGTGSGSAPDLASGSARDPELPFTGLPVGWVVLAGALLAGCGVALRKTARS
jgi:hypothetical protein